MKTIKLEKCATNTHDKIGGPKYKGWMKVYKINVQTSLKSDERK